MSFVGRTMGAYQLLEPIGTGGMGEVFLALDTRLGRRVALKFLAPGLTHDSYRLHRFRQEARATSGLNHPNILTVHELGEIDGHHFIASEFVDGETLRDRLAKGPIPVPVIIDVATQVASALAAAHGAGVVHRDIKPENVMLRRDGYVKVLDFGLAKLLEPNVARPSGSTDFSTREGFVMGTRDYMSPEQAFGDPVDARSDIWSLGVVMYELVSGRLPFQSPTLNATVAAILQVKQSPPGGPESLARIIERALEKDPAARYQSAEEVLVDLRKLQSEAGQASASWRRFRFDRRVAVTIGFAGLLAVAAAVAAAVAFRSRPEPVRSVAVLPFVNMSGNRDAEYLADGMTEELINALALLPELKVVSRTSSFAFKDKGADIRDVADKLNVGAVVEGSMRRDGDRLHITVRLVNARDGEPLWSEVYDRELTGIFVLQSQIASAVAGALHARPSGAPAIARSAPRNLRAYEMYVRGRTEASVWSRPRLELAISLFKQSIALDPSFADAYAGLADAYSLLDHRPGLSTLKPDESYRLAIAAATQALRINDRSADAHAALGHIYTHQGNFADATTHLRRAVALNPNSGVAHLWYAILLGTQRRYAESKQELILAREGDPLSLQVAQVACTSLWVRGDYESALDFCARGSEVAPEFAELHSYTARVYATMGRFREAEAALNKADSAAERSVITDDDRLLVLALAGRATEALAAVETLERKRPIALMRIYAAAGRLDDAIHWAETFATQQPEYARLTMGVPPHPAFAALLADPRYQRLRRELGLPPP